MISMNCVVEAQDGIANPAEEKDPFGDADPFAMIGMPSDAAGRLGGRQEASPTSNRPDAQAEIFFKYNLIDTNNTSRVLPDDISGLKTNTAILETRMLVSDSLSERHEWRWLFRGYANTDNQRETDGRLRSRLRIDEIFSDWKNQGTFASFGKRRINWGHAQAFNPVNVVAPRRDPLDPSNETEGRPMLWISRAIANANAEIVLTRNYDNNWHSDKNRWGLRYGIPVEESDFAFYYFDGSDYSDGRGYERMLGASFSSNLVPGLTLYMEAADFFKDYRNYYAASGVARYKDHSYFQGVIGSSIDLGEKSGVFIEYYFNGQGYSAAERKTYLRAVDVQRAAGSETALTNDFVELAMNRSYLLMNFRKEYREKYLFNLSVLTAADGSYSARMEVDYALSDYYEARMSYLNNNGNRDSEFGNHPVTGGLEIGLRASF